MTESVETGLVARMHPCPICGEAAHMPYSGGRVECRNCKGSVYGVAAWSTRAAAAEIERLQAELREACHDRDGYMAERDMARERLEWPPDQPYDGIAARDETIAGLQAELARVRKLGEVMAVEYGRAQHWMERAFADPDSLKNRLSVMDVFADQLERNRTALAAWNAGEGR